jgi:carboxypeptidase T
MDTRSNSRQSPRARRGFLRLTVAAAALAVAMAPACTRPAEPDPAPGGGEAAAYEVLGARTWDDANRVAQTGAAIDEIEHGHLHVTATAAEAEAIRALGLTVEPVVEATAFPAADARYHSYAETMAELEQVVADHPAIARTQVFGTSYEGRALVALKISDNVGVDENEPEVLYDAHQHAREHLTVEMALYLVHLFTDEYGRDPRVTGVVDGREIWIVPDLNPDGGEYDVATGRYRSWRKNRQPNNWFSVGTDLNRNWGYQWGCCRGSSGTPSSETYRGPAAFSAPETRALRDFVLSRRVGGVQQIRTHLDFHSYQELVLWPFGYTLANTTPALDPDQEATFRTLGVQMARTNGYTPQQISDLYVADGNIVDWMWGDQGIFSYTFEMYPRTAREGGFYPPDEVIAAQTARNREASLLLAEYADCPYRVAGRQQRCAA